jgi:hypothetical protein
MIHVIGPNYKMPERATIINTTSRSVNWSRSLSPFFCGPVNLYGGYKSVNVENAWQFSKCYEYYLESDGAVGERYFKWAQDGWNDTHAHRYPMGKGVVPLYSIWDGEKLTYVEARKKIYIPLYSSAVIKTSAFAKLKKLYEENKDIYLWDFDAHGLKPGTFDYWDLWNNPNIKVGHAYVLAMLLEGLIV